MEDVHESGWQMITPMVLLAVLCAVIGVLPVMFSRLIESAVFCWLPGLAVSSARLSALAPLESLSMVNAFLLIIGFFIAYSVLRRVASRPNAETVTWDCGYLEPSPRMQYTASSFAEILTKLNAVFLRPDSHNPKIKGIFPSATSFYSHVPEVFLEHVYLPVLKGLQASVSPLRRLQHGQLHLYVLYILITLVSLLFWSNW